MDTTLPIITRTAGQQFVVVSIFHGLWLDFSVPFLVTFVLLDIGLLPSFDRYRSLTRAIFISLNPINNENQTLYLSPFFAALHRCPGRQRAVAKPTNQRNEQRNRCTPTSLRLRNEANALKQRALPADVRFDVNPATERRITLDGTWKFLFSKNNDL